MRKWYIAVLAMLMTSVAYADGVSIPTELNLKQGFIIPWEDPSNGFSNMTTLTVMETEPWEGIGPWNALWAGNTIDLAWSYDANTSNVGVMFGRKLGTLGDYLPIAYPLAGKVDITLYPVGIIVESPMDDPTISGASGAGIIKFDITF